MTSREKVLKVYPDARCVKYNEAAMGELYRVFNAAGEPLSDLMFQNADCAWDDAASKLPPGSPAGETASRLTFDLTKPEQMIAASGAVEALHDAGFRGAAGSAKCVVCRDFESNIREWIEQLGGNPDVQHISLELERLIDVVAPSVRPSAPEAAAALAAELGVEYVVTYEHRLAARKRFPSIEPDSLAEDIGARLEAVLEQSAAPIAPAAEELMRELQTVQLALAAGDVKVAAVIIGGLIARAEEAKNG